jgi:hypothetical protein
MSAPDFFLASAVVDGDLGSDRDPCLLAEAAFEPNNPESRDALAIELFGDDARRRALFRLCWDILQQKFEQGVL